MSQFIVEADKEDLYNKDVDVEYSIDTVDKEMKVAHLLKVIDDYSLSEIESLIPDKKSLPPV